MKQIRKTLGQGETGGHPPHPIAEALTEADQYLATHHAHAQPGLGPVVESGAMHGRMKLPCLHTVFHQRLPETVFLQVQLSGIVHVLHGTTAAAGKESTGRYPPPGSRRTVHLKGFREPFALPPLENPGSNRFARQRVLDSNAPLPHHASAVALIVNIGDHELDLPRHSRSAHQPCSTSRLRLTSGFGPRCTASASAKIRLAAWRTPGSAKSSLPICSRIPPSIPSAATSNP